MTMSRKGFLGAAAMAAAGPVGAHQQDSAPPDPPAITTGEPYRLAGRRLVFTTWLYVRPGGFGWFDAQGRNVTVAGSEQPFGATFRRVDHPFGVRLASRAAERRGPVIRPEKPWETGGRGLSFGCILHERDRLRAWGGCPAGPCVWESTDGIEWQRPELGLVEHGGHKRTNLIPGAPGAVFVDPAAPESERCKSVVLGDVSLADYAAFRRRRPGGWEPRAWRKDVGHVYALRGLVSPDGLRWTTLPEPLSMEHSDTQIVAAYDSAIRRYVVYTRAYMIGARAAGAAGDPMPWWGGDAGGPGRRAIGRTESADFREFPVSQVVLETAPQMRADDVLYTNCRTTIPGAPDHPLMFPAIWHTYDDTTTIVLATSHDGRVWNFAGGAPALDTAPFGQWDGGCVFAQPNLVELPDGGWALPYTGYDVPHKYPRGQFRFAPGLAVWPRGRLMCIEAEQRGEFATVAFLPPTRRVRLNVVTKRAGSVLVEAANRSGAPVAGRTFADARPIVGDHAAAPVVWSAHDDVGLGADEPLVLRFRLDRAAIYAVDFA